MSRILILFLVASYPAAACTGAGRVLVLGDSLSAGYGLQNLDEGWVSLLQRRLEEKGYSHQVANASVSGDTSSAALARLDAALQTFAPAVVIIELGGNDGLRGIGPDEMRRNLRGIIERLLSYGARILLVPMELPPNYGAAYIERFRTVYRELAERYEIPQAAFLLEGVALNAELMQEDGIHPRAEAQPRMLDNVWPALLPLLADCGTAP